MSELYLDELRVGLTGRSQEHEVTEKEIVDYARLYDPQPFHLDAKSARKTLFRGLVASGWMTAGITMRLMVLGDLRLAGGLIGLAVDGLGWPRPVRAGDVLHVESEVVEVLVSKEKPERGTVRIRMLTKNQRGETVQTGTATLLARARPQGQKRGPPDAADWAATSLAGLNILGRPVGL